MLDDAHLPSAEAIDSETACLLRSFMVPAIDAAKDWRDLDAKLARKGFRIAFRDGRLVFKKLEDDTEICTGGFLGTPLRALVAKLGRPSVRANPDGHTGSLMV